MPNTKRPARQMPDGAADAFREGWQKAAEKTNAIPRTHSSGAGSGWNGSGSIAAIESMSPEDWRIARIKKWMREDPDWFEQRPEQFKKIAAADAEYVAKLLEASRNASGPVEVFTVPFYAFNFLIDEAPGFVRRGPRALHNAKLYVEGRCVDEFLNIWCPPRLRLVLVQIAVTNWVLSVSELPASDHLGSLVFSVERPLE